MIRHYAASFNRRGLKNTAFCSRVNIRASGGTGRRTGLKILRGQPHGSSTLPSPIIFMKLVFIYGQPGVGKLTVAKALAEATGYKLFHNHLTADLVYSLFPFGSKECFALADKLRLDLIEAAAKHNVKGVIFTFVYGVKISGDNSDAVFVKNVLRIVRKHRGEVFFVKLVCNEKELRRRIRHPSRKAFRKLRKVKNLLITRQKYILDATIPFGKSYIIDNAHISPKKVAVMIQKHYRL